MYEIDICHFKNASSKGSLFACPSDQVFLIVTGSGLLHEVTSLCPRHAPSKEPLGHQLVDKKGNHTC